MHVRNMYLRPLRAAVVGVCVSAALAALPARGDEVGELVEKLSTAVGAELYRAVDRLAGHGPAAREATGELTKLLADADKDLRWRAARALGAIGPAAAGAVGPLSDRLEDEDAMVRAQSAFALGLIGEAAKPAAADLVEAVADEDPLVRRAALRALHRLGPDRDVTRPLFQKILETSDVETVNAVLHSMAEMGADAVPALADALEHEEARYWATLVIQEIGPEAKPLAPKLAELALVDDEPEVRMHAIMALGAIGKDANKAVDVIVDRLKNDPFNAVKYAAAFALPEIADPQAKDALQTAHDANVGEDGDLFLRVAAARGLARMYPDDEALEKQNVEAFIEGLQSEHGHVRRAAAQAMAESAAPSEEVAPRLVAALAEADHDVVTDVLIALASLGEQAVPRLKHGLENEDLRRYAVVVLGDIGPPAKDAVPELMRALDVEDDSAFRREVLFTLGRIGPPAAPAVDKIVQILETTDDERMVAAACYALGGIGPAASKAGPALVHVYNEGDSYQKTAAIWALLKVRPGYDSVERRAIPLLTKTLSHQRADIRAEAARALGGIGPKAAPALPELEKLLKDDHPDVRAAAKEAMEQIQR